MNGGFEAVWLYIKALLPPGLDGALESGGRENGIIPTNFHGLDFEIFDAVFETHRVRWQICYRLRRQFVDDPDGLIGFIEKYKAGKTDEEWEAGRPVMVTNDGPEPKDVGEHA